MYEKSKKNNTRSCIIAIIFALTVAVLMGLFFRPILRSKASATFTDATLSDAMERLPSLRSGVDVASSTDVDKSPYLTNNVTILQTNDLLLSIRNILVCIWFTILIIWAYEKLKAIIFRLGGFKKL